jgi:glucose/arabinose dehydrogenase
MPSSRPNAVLLLLLACASTSPLSVADTTGPHPTLVEPRQALAPDVNIATARGWRTGQTPLAAPGAQVVAFARDLDHPRWLYVLPNGDVLVAETNAPPRPDDSPGLKGAVMKSEMKRSGAAVPSANRITLLRDTDGDGVADLRTVLLAQRNSPFGMALVGDTLYVADSDQVVRFPYARGETSITAAPVTVLALPAGPINHHWTKNLLPTRDGSTLYVTVGSNSDMGERGLAAEEGRASIWEVDLKTGTHRVFATGLRNANGLAFEPTTGALWTVVNERDELGNDLVPDYLTSVRDGAFYGWPYSWYGAHVDVRVTPARPDLVASAVVPDYALGAHVAPLGLAEATGSALPWKEGMFVGLHGSWNRRPRSGYKVIFVPFAKGQPAGPPTDVLTGFLTSDGEASGRPVGVALDAKGALLVADDVGNTIWRVTAAEVSAR